MALVSLWDVKVWKWLSNAQRSFIVEKLRGGLCQDRTLKGVTWLEWEVKQWFWLRHFILVVLAISRDCVHVFLSKCLITPSKYKSCLAERFISNSSCWLCLKAWLFRLLLSFFQLLKTVTFNLVCDFKNVVHIWVWSQDLQTLWSSNLQLVV